MIERNVLAKVPIRLEVPAEMTDAIAHVLAGEYDYGFSGRGLTVLDIGANVGAFSIWADMRWPGSTIYAYEPHPGTFAMLERNLRGALQHNRLQFRRIHS
jgi:tRNA1(Val) A37 N6-methylase TrmN6